MRSDIDLGLTGERPALLDLTELLATRLLVQGNSGLRQVAPAAGACWSRAPASCSRQSSTRRAIFASLADRYGHVVVEADGDDAALQRIAARVRTHRVSVVLSLENLDADGQMRAAGRVPRRAVRRRPGPLVPDAGGGGRGGSFSPPAAAGEVSDEARRLSLGAMTNLMCRGRKRGLAGIIATQRLAKLAKNVAAEASNFLMGRDLPGHRHGPAPPISWDWSAGRPETFRDLPRGHFVALGAGPVPAAAHHRGRSDRDGEPGAPRRCSCPLPRRAGGCPVL